MSGECLKINISTLAALSNNFDFVKLVVECYRLTEGG